MTDAAPTAVTPADAATVSAGTAAAAVPATPTAPAVAAVPVAAPAVAQPAAAAPVKPAEAPKETPSLLEGAKKPESPAGEPNGQKTDAAPSTDAAALAPYDFKLPDNVKIADEAEFKAFKDVLQKSNVPVDKAPEVVAYIAEQRGKLEAAALVKQREVWTTTNDGWKDQVMADPKIGGENWKTVEPQIAGVIDEFGKDIPTLRQTLTMTGAGNHPDVVKFMYNISEVLKEGGMVLASKGANTKPKSKATTLYTGS